MDTAALQAKATDIRKDILTMITEAGSGHPGGSLSCTDILTALYFGGVMDYDANDPAKVGRDRFILAKGHAAPALYAPASSRSTSCVPCASLARACRGIPTPTFCLAWRCPPARSARGFPWPRALRPACV